MATLPSALSGIPFSSNASPITAAPYFATTGKIVSKTASSPFTELIIGLPL